MKYYNFIEAVLAEAGLLALGGLVGALWRGLSKPQQSIIKTILEGVAAVGSAMVFGGLFVGIISTVFSVDTTRAAIAAGAICAFFGDKIFRVVSRKISANDQNLDTE